MNTIFNNFVDEPIFDTNDIYKTISDAELFLLICEFPQLLEYKFIIDNFTK